MMNGTTTGRSLFRDVSVLTDEYSPETPIGRDDSIAQLRAAVQPVAHQKPPGNVAVVGPPGTGKTTVVTHVLEELQRETRVRTATINCWQYNTRPAFLTELLIKLGYPAPRKGTPIDTRLTTFQELLAKSDGLIVALDEFDQCSHQTELVYDLLDAAAATETELALILVSNQSLDALGLDARSQSRLACRELAVPPYTAADLEAILQDHIKKAFQPNAVAPDAIERIAAIVAEDGGDCRQAFDLLLRAGRRADRNQANEVTTEHVEESRTAHEA